jgi:hypothetical protein
LVANNGKVVVVVEVRGRETHEMESNLCRKALPLPFGIRPQKGPSIKKFKQYLTISILFIGA